jgi:hypothetical protein
MSTVDDVPIDVTVGPDEDEEEQPETMVSVSIIGPHKVNYQAAAFMNGEHVTPAAIAAALVRVACASAAAAGSDIWFELQRRLAEPPSTPADGS